jgi:hypothetical protein
MKARINEYGKCRNDGLYLCADGEILYAAQQRNNDEDYIGEGLAARLSQVLHAFSHGQNDAAAGIGLAPLQRRFEVIAHTYPGAPAIRCRDQVLSYGELDAEADELALDLQRAGLAPGSFCAVRLQPSLAQVRVILAIVKAGAAYVQFDRDLAPERMALVLQVLQPSILFVDAAERMTDSDSAMRIVRCEEEAARLPYGWPDEAPVGPATPAHVFAGVANDGGVCIWICTHLGLGKAPDAMRRPPPLAGCGADPAALWRPLSAGAVLTIPARL